VIVTRILKFPSVHLIVGKSRTTLWRWELEGKFPKRVKTGSNSIGWLDDEIIGWVAAKAAERGIDPDP
jgi:prophage regulatory protein